MADEEGGAHAPVATPAVPAVSIKLPPFWPTDPTVKLSSVLMVAPLRKPRFEYVIVLSSLSPDIAVEIQDLLINPPADNP